MTKKDLPMYLLWLWASLATTFAAKYYFQLNTPAPSPQGWLSAPPLVQGKILHCNQIQARTWVK